MLVCCVSLGWRSPVVKLFRILFMSGFESGSLGGDAGSDGPLRGWSGVFPSFAYFGRGLQPLLFPLCLFVVWVILGSKIKLGLIVITSVAFSFHMLLSPVPFEPYCFFFLFLWRP